MIASWDYEQVVRFMYEHANAAILLGALLILFCLALAGFEALRRLQRQSWIVRASRLLDEPQLVRGPLGVVTHARGSFDGARVVVSAKGIELVAAQRTTLATLREVRELDPGTLAARLRERVAALRQGTLVRGVSPSSTCPYCKDAVAPRESGGTIRCPSCSSVHHTPCWQEHGGCSVHGCARVPGEEASRVRGARPN